VELIESLAMALCVLKLSGEVDLEKEDCTKIRRAAIMYIKALPNPSEEKGIKSEKRLH